jgi:WD40 repeat protein
MRPDLWGLYNGAEIRQMVGHTNAVKAVAISADGKFTLSGSADGSLIAWEQAAGKLIRKFSGGTIINTVAISPDGHSVLSGSPDGRLTI